MIEPFASERLRRVSVASALSAVSPVHLLADVDAPPAARFAEGYAVFREEALGSDSVASAFLATMGTQAEALALVWEAHARGAVTLPPRVAAAVQAACAAARR